MSGDSDVVARDVSKKEGTDAVDGRRHVFLLANEPKIHLPEENRGEMGLWHCSLRVVPNLAAVIANRALTICPDSLFASSTFDKAHPATDAIIIEFLSP